MQSAVSNLFDEYARQAEVETPAQAGLLESEGCETDAEDDDYSSFGKRSLRSLNTQRKGAVVNPASLNLPFWKSRSKATTSSRAASSSS